MADNGAGLPARLYGRPWFEKPVLYYWAAAIGFRLHFPAEWAARLPSAFAALAAAITIGWLAWKFYGATAPFAWNPALLAPLMFSTSVGAIGFARAATPDMLFSACIALAMASATCILEANGTLRAPAPNALGLRLKSRRTHRRVPARRRKPTLAVAERRSTTLFVRRLSGPRGTRICCSAAIILAGRRNWFVSADNKAKQRAAFRAAHPLAIATFCIVALPWYILCAVRESRLHLPLHFSAQFRTILDAVISASPAILVFHSNYASRDSSLGRAPLARDARRRPTLARALAAQFPGIVFFMLGSISSFILQPDSIETAQLHSSNSPAISLTTRGQVMNLLRQSIRGEAVFRKKAHENSSRQESSLQLESRSE